MGSFLMERIFWLTPNGGVLTAHTEWLPDVRLRHSVPSVQYSYIENCEGWWSSGCRGSVAEHRWLKPEVSGVLGSTPGD